jgi:hypothetical protein
MSRRKKTAAIATEPEGISLSKVVIIYFAFNDCTVLIVMCFVFADVEAGADPAPDPIVAAPAPDPIVAALQAKIEKLELEAEQKKKPAKVKVKKVRVSKYKAIHAKVVADVEPILAALKTFNCYHLLWLSQRISFQRTKCLEIDSTAQVSASLYSKWITAERKKGKLSGDVGDDGVEDEVEEAETEEDEEEEDEEDVE